MGYEKARLRVFNLQDFGAVADNVTDCYPAFQRAMLAAGPPPSTAYPLPPFTQWNAKVLIYIPPANAAYFFSRPISLWRSVHLFSDGSGEWAGGYEDLGVPPTTLRFPKGVPGIVIEQQGVPSIYNPFFGNPIASNTTGRKSIIEGLNLHGSYVGADVGTVGAVPVWTNATRYNIGDIVIPTYFLPYGYAYKAIVGGVSGAQEPVWSTADAPFPIPTYNVGDGGVTWALIRADAFMCNTDCTIRDVRILAFAGNGIGVFADVGKGNGANEMRVDDCDMLYCGGSGLAVAGGDTNTGIYKGITTQHCGGYGVWDFSPLRTTIIGPKDAGSRAGSYYCRTSYIINPYSEAGGGPPVIDSGASCSGGVIGDGFFSGDFFTDWTAGAAHLVDDIILETTSGQYWICLQNGNSAAGRPNFVTNSGAPFGRFYGSDPTRNVVADGTTSWGAYGEAGQSGAPTWRPNTDYPTGSRVKATMLGYGWINLGAPFTSGGVEPVWNTVAGSNTPDNGGQWSMPAQGLPISTGVVEVDTGGTLGSRHTQFVQRSGAIGLRIDLSNHTIPSNALSASSSDDANYANLLRFDYDSAVASKSWFWNYLGLPTARLLEFTVTGNTTFGAGQINFPNGIFAGSFFSPAGIVASSYLGPFLRLAGSTDTHEGHELGQWMWTRDGKVTNDAVEVVAGTLTLENQRIEFFEVKVTAKTYTTTLDGAVFYLRGAWRKDTVGGVPTVTEIAAPSVVYTSGTAGAAAWTARLLYNAGTKNVDVLVKGAAAVNILWSVFPEESDSPLFPYTP